MPKATATYTIVPKPGAMPPATASMPPPATSRRMRRTGGATVSPDAADTPLPLPPPTPDELHASSEIIANLEHAAVLLQQHNLDRAVALAIEAAAGRGELVEHFVELGRRFGQTLGASKRRPSLRLVRGARS